ncbi:MAG: hypothetical protein LHW56_01605 [Candidatus Cloacimonetes bacterium]|nr:hypothetical protein [Candidatus Cloacimonadota bacterium]MDY0171583.1 hypothetical protein [Candidatus Cloacimonadaceae bacterium]
MKSNYTSPYTPAQAASGPLFEVGIVVDCNPQAYTVDIKMEGLRLLTGVPLLDVYGAPHSRDVSWLRDLRGARVLVGKIGGTPIVFGTLPVEGVGGSTEEVPPLAEAGYGGSEAHTYLRSSEKHYSGGRPVDMFPQDKVLRTSSGVLLNLLNEGLAVLKASPLCQIVLGRFRDFVRVVARRFQLYTDFGEVETTHEAGRVGLSFRGGADFAAETHPEVAEWTVRAWLGHDPSDVDARLHLLVNNVAQDQYVDLVFDQNGNIKLQATHDATMQVGNNIGLVSESGHLTVDVQTGNTTVHTKGKTIIHSEGTIDIDGGSGDLSGAVTQKCICPFTGHPHSDWSGDVVISK